MTLELVSLRQFKCFEAVDITLAPLTFLTGFNGAGKSTLLQSLLLLSQGLRNASGSRYLQLNGPLIRLGTAADVVRRDAPSPIEFGVKGFGSEFQWKFAGASSGDQPVSDDEDGEEDPTNRERLRVLQVYEDGRALYSEREIARLRPVTSRLRTALRRIIYIGATRHSRRDIFPFPDDPDPAHADVGNEGQFAPWWYVRTADNNISLERQHPDDSSVTLRAQIDAWLNYLFPGAAASAETIGGTGHARLVFKIGRKSGWVRPVNIGYGLSYVFPIIVALLNARNGQTVIIDSPEAHLHPKAQSRMGIMLARFAQAGVQILIETHSDHILSGARLAVREQVIEHRSIAVHFFSGINDRGHGIISPIIRADGRLSDWPEGFFDQADLDLAALAEP